MTGRIRIAGLGLAVMLLLLPVVHAPFFSDDVTYSELHGYLRISGHNLIGFDFQQVWDVLAHSGRPTILSWLPGYPAFALLGDHPVEYHLYILLATALAGLVVYGMLRQLRAPAAVAALAVVLAAGWMQVRVYHDSLLSFAALSQFVLAAVAGSVWCFSRWLDDGRRRDLILAVLLFAAACGLYEVSYSLCLAHIALAFTHRRGRAAARAAAPIVGVAVLFGLATVVLRKTADSVDTGYQVGGGGGVWTMLRTYAIQLISPLPDMNLLGNPPLGADPSKGELFAGAWRGFAMAGGVVVAGLAFLRSETPVRWAPIVAVAAALYVAPPVLLAVAPKYQTELTLSLAYLPVLIQIFALAVLAVAALGAVIRVAAGRSRAMALVVLAGVAAFAGLTTGVTAFNNIRVVGLLQPDRASRSLVEAAAEHGTYTSLPAGTSIFYVDRDLAWQGPTGFHGYLYLPLMLAHKTDRVYDARLFTSAVPPGSCPDAGTPVEADCAPPHASAAYSRVRLRHDGGTVIMAAFDGSAAATTYPQAPATRLVVFRDGDESQPPALVGTTPKGHPWTSTGLVWHRDAHGGDWSRWSVALAGPRRVIAASLDDPAAFVDFTAMPPEPQRARLMGTRHLLP